MKILLLYTYNQGYLSGFFTELAHHFSQIGHQVDCFSLKSKDAVFNEQQVSYVIAKRGGYLKTYSQIFRIIKHTKPDVIVSNFSYVNPALLCGRLLDVKKNIVWFHSLNEQTAASPRNIFIKKQFLKLADRVIANSELTKTQLHEVYQVPLHKLVSIPFWTHIHNQTSELAPVPEITMDADFINVGCPGRLETSKNQKIVLEAVAKLYDRGHQNVRLYVAGKGHDRIYLDNLAKQLGISNRVVFLSHLSHHEMVTFYKSMDVVVLPSLHEAFGLVFIEAIALGTPVIVSERFGALTFIDSDMNHLTDFTFHPQSVDSLVEKLLPYAERHGLSGSLFKQLYQENFDKEIIYNKLRRNITA